MSETNDALLELLVGKIKDDTKGYADKQITDMKAEIEKGLAEVKEMAKDMVQQAKEAIASCGHIVNLGTVEKPAFEKTHSVFDKITKVLSSSKRKEKNIMLVGGAGGGKTHLVKQIADTLKLPFYPMSVGFQTTKSDLLGFISATGIYMPSCIRQAYENGGVLLLDEFDAAHAGVVTILNSLLANGHCSFPDKVINKHKDFVCLVACNTFGTGANMEYIGRNRLDGATLDRFITIEVDYDKELEKDLTNNPKWFGVIQKFRENAKSQGIKQIISPRASMDGADLLDAGFDIEDVLNMTVFKGCSQEIKEKLLGRMTILSLRSDFESMTCPQLEGMKKSRRKTKSDICSETEKCGENFDYVCEFNFEDFGRNGKHFVKEVSGTFKTAIIDLKIKGDGNGSVRFSNSWCSNGVCGNMLYCIDVCGAYDNMMPAKYEDYINFLTKMSALGVEDSHGKKYKFILKNATETREFTVGV